MTERRVEILLVEDDLPDIRLTQRALKGGKLHKNVSVARDGVEAKAFDGSYRGAQVVGRNVGELGKVIIGSLQLLGALLKPLLYRLYFPQLVLDQRYFSYVKPVNHRATQYEP